MEGKPITVPSGQLIYWQDMITGNPGAHGLTYRFRFVAPDLANLVPMASPAPMEALTEEDMAALDALAESEGGAATIISDAIIEGLISSTELDQTPVISLPLDMPIDEIAESPTDSATGDFVLPPAPDSLLRDPMHDDIVWLCENFVLPRIASPAPRPSKIVISLADRPLDSAGLEPGAVQLFEAFSLPADRDECIWEPL
ncbi:DUF6497 family protein [Paracoccus albus]|uniref:DUF6497 family protein n=1 Tax=Paracoccus albus TaxID=3017784 RepID=UPI0022F0510A|nr:DUF6497 family protein [Paracoccus albus]WBU59038.1 DUF6497 family protein [Paracoccus albus]